ncbi:MAG: GNAT family N-acetyltransferase [Clostridia bacterium]
MVHKGTITIETERLILRRFALDDADAMYRNWASDAEVTKYLTWQPHTNISVSKDVINSWLPLYQNPNHYSWAIVLKKIGEPIGSIAIVKQNESTNMVHFGYALGRKWWQQGIMSEALARLICFFFEEVGVNRIESMHDPNNPNSGRVMQKCGLRYEGTMRQSDKNNQGICDAVNYAILREEYFARK